MERLGTDRLDIVHVHDPDDHLDDVLRYAYPTLLRLRDDGVIGAIGLGTNHAHVALHVTDHVALDWVLLAGRYTLLDRSGAERLLPRCAERGIGVVAAGVFNSGLLADPTSGATFDYQPAPDEQLRRALAHGRGLRGSRRPPGRCRHPVPPLGIPPSRWCYPVPAARREVYEDLDLLALPVPDELVDQLDPASDLEGPVRHPSVDQRVAGQAEDALADLVALDLRRAAGDRQGPVHEHQRAAMAAGTVEERGVGAGELG